MKILIASDLHGSWPALKFLAEKAEALKPDLLVLLGDLVYHGPRNPLPAGYDTLHILKHMNILCNLPCPVSAVAGNCDAEVDIEQMPFPMPQNAWIDADGLAIFASHGHKIPEHGPITGLKPGTVVLRGHTHIPRAETEGNLHFWNPGSLSLPKGGFPGSYGFYENGTFYVLDVNDKEIMRHSPSDN